MPVFGKENVINRFSLLKGVTALFFVAGSVLLYFGLLFHYRPSNAIAFIATAGFTLLMSVMIQSLEPVFTAFAVVLVGRERKARPAFKESDRTQQSIEATIAALEDKKQPEPSDLLELMAQRTVKHEMLLHEMRKDIKRQSEKT